MQTDQIYLCWQSRARVPTPCDSLSASTAITSWRYQLDSPYTTAIAENPEVSTISKSCMPCAQHSVCTDRGRTFTSHVLQGLPAYGYTRYVPSPFCSVCRLLCWATTAVHGTSAENICAELTLPVGAACYCEGQASWNALQHTVANRLTHLILAAALCVCFRDGPE